MRWWSGGNGKNLFWPSKSRESPAFTPTFQRHFPEWQTQLVIPLLAYPWLTTICVKDDKNMFTNFAVLSTTVRLCGAQRLILESNLDKPGGIHQFRLFICPQSRKYRLWVQFYFYRIISGWFWVIKRHDRLSKRFVEIGYNSRKLSPINWVWYLKCCLCSEL